MAGYNSYWIDSGTKVIGVVIEKNFVEITVRQPSNLILTSNPPQSAPDKIWKDIYVVKDGQLVFDRKIDGIHIPSHSVAEKIEFPGNINSH